MDGTTDEKNKVDQSGNSDPKRSHGRSRITDEMVKDQPKFGQIAKGLKAHL
jgi:DNA polymerase III epsilon subunit-like protein